MYSTIMNTAAGGTTASTNTNTTMSTETTNTIGVSGIGMQSTTTTTTTSHQQQLQQQLQQQQQQQQQSNDTITTLRQQPPYNNNNLQNQQQQPVQPIQHFLPSVAGSVIYADVSGNNNNTNQQSQSQSQSQSQQQDGISTTNNSNNSNNNSLFLQIRIQNISSTANLGIKLDLKKIALKCRNTEYNPKRFAAVIMRLRAEPRATALLFSSGKMVITGVKSTHNATLASKKIAYIIERVNGTSSSAGTTAAATNTTTAAVAAAAATATTPNGIPTTPTGTNTNTTSEIIMDFKVQNIIGTANVGFPIRLEGLVYAHSAFASYEPELFPGLIYRLVHPRVVILVFVSGKLVITGAKRESDLITSLIKLYPTLVEYKKISITPSPITTMNTTTTATATTATAPPTATTTTTAGNGGIGKQFPGKRPRSMSSTAGNNNNNGSSGNNTGNDSNTAIEL